MAENEVLVILEKLKALDDKFEDFKKDVKEEFASMKNDSKDKCASCLNSELLKQSVTLLAKDCEEDLDRSEKGIYLHIRAIWTVIGAGALTLFGALVTHVMGKL